MNTTQSRLILGLGLGLVLALLSSRAVQAADDEPQRSISVTGSGEVQAKPDRAQVSAGVVTQGNTAAAALDENSKTMQAVFAGLAGFGIPKEDVQTSSFSILSQYTRPAPRSEEPPQLVGYRVVNQLTVTIRNLDRLGKGLDMLVRLGANQLHGVEFTVSDPEPLLDQARIEAVRAARHKAELLSQAAGAKLGRVLSIQETSRHLPQPALSMRAETVASVPIAAGRETLTVSVTVRFALE
jgi:uncharacterized protein YggE